MKESTLKNVKGVGYFMGAAAYGFMHAPMILVDGLKSEHKEKKWNREQEKRKKELAHAFIDAVMEGDLEKSNRLHDELDGLCKGAEGRTVLFSFSQEIHRL